MQIAVFATLHRPHALEIVRQATDWLLRHAHAVRMSAQLAAAVECDTCAVPAAEVAAGADFAVAIGGDGTMLGAVRASAPHRAPVLGVNAGALGFLTEITPDELPEYLPRAIAGDYSIESRIMLRGELFRGKEILCDALALNDIVVRQGAQGRLIHLDVLVAGHQLGHFGADGLIVSTPTGSTAYGLSAGGPIVHPETRAMVLVPICPHSLSFRPMVIPAMDPVEILCEGNQHGDEMSVTADGQEPRIVQAGDRIIVSPATDHALLMKFGLSSFYERLREKLRWGSG